MAVARNLTGSDAGRRPAEKMVSREKPAAEPSPEQEQEQEGK
ncbi:hypothetical protein [Micromonospora sp. RTGN7]|nr:hypothetical protein [Micromonospora sp. RTGN7]